MTSTHCNFSYCYPSSSSPLFQINPRFCWAFVFKITNLKGSNTIGAMNKGFFKKKNNNNRTVFLEQFSKSSRTIDELEFE